LFANGACVAAEAIGAIPKQSTAAATPTTARETNARIRIIHSITELV
jgi:hypothetical protein